MQEEKPSIERDLFKHYRPDDEKFLDYSLLQLDNFYKTRTSIKDPEHLNGKASMLNRIKTALLKTDKYRHPNYDKELDALWNRYPSQSAKIQIFSDLPTAYDQYRQQKAYRTGDELEQALSKVNVVPANLQNYHLPSDQSTKRKTQQDLNDKKRIKDLEDHKTEMRTWTGDEMAAILKGLISPHLSDIVPALLLATGRRSSELRTSAHFEPVEGKPYKAIFRGQMKSSTPDERRTIPLLAPYWLVDKAFMRMRGEINLDHFERYTKKFNTKPHGLRALYAVACNQIFNKTLPLNDYMMGILGHAKPGTSIHYNHVKVIKPEILSLAPVPVKADIKYQNSWQERRIDDLIKYMSEQKKITISSLRRLYGGSTDVWKGLLFANDNLIKQYNDFF